MKKIIYYFVLSNISFFIISCNFSNQITRYSVSFESNGGSSVESQEVSSLVEEPCNPIKNGYNFVGWYKDSNFSLVWDFDNDSVSEDITLYANWEFNLERIQPNDFEVSDEFGNSSSIYGDILAIGSRYDDNHGTVHIYENSDNGWIAKQIITSDDISDNDDFGYAVSLYGDYLLVGANRASSNGDNNGCAYIFKKENGQFIQKQKLEHNEVSKTGLNFGESVSLYGTIAVVGCPFGTSSVVASTGTVYVFEKNSSDETWTRKQIISKSDLESHDNFGSSVAIYDDTIVIGSFMNNGNVANSGSAFVYKKDNLAIWQFEDKLISDDGSSFDMFGSDVSIYEDRIVVGTRYSNDNVNNKGTVYIYERDDSTWDQVDKLRQVVDDSEEHKFGISVDTYENYIVVGDLAGDIGEVLLFEKVGEDWLEKTKIEPLDNEDTLPLGFDVSINSEYLIGGTLGATYIHKYFNLL